ncbi:MAG: DNA mismatch repair endonuclease MutL [Peptococcaceae bacterium]|nr:DNA mismatch repair endonuclease MutL [Peptococcaceae bacterium]
MSEPQAEQSIINILDAKTTSQIAAGEVVERPVSLVKELVENSIDAGSKNIIVKLWQTAGGTIQVVDDGCGMTAGDMPTAIKNHATSKIQSIEDLESSFSLGFRGEALASIAAISKMEMISRTKNSLSATRLLIEAGVIVETTEEAAPIGTSILVKDLFYNTPARKKFLKSYRVETDKIFDFVYHISLCRPDISFLLQNEGKTVFKSPGQGDLAGAALAIYGGKTAKNLMPIHYENPEEGISLEGLVSLPALTRASRQYYNFFVNGRWVRSPELAKTIDKVYYTVIPEGKYPIIILHLNVPPNQIDVNVHPSKMEIKFADDEKIKQIVGETISNALAKKERLIPVLEGKHSGTELFPNQTNLAAPVPFRQMTAAEPPAREYKIVPQTPPIHKTEQEIEYLAAEKSQYGENEMPEEIVYDVPLNMPYKSGVIQGAMDSPFKQDKPHIQLPDLFSDRDDTTPAASSKKFRFSDLRPLGQIDATYIAAVGDDGLYLMDQHAAHERILYEKLRKQYYETEGDVKGEKISYLLAVPLPVDLNTQEKLRLVNHIVELSELGFVIEEFGENTYLLRGVPAWFQSLGCDEGIFIEILDMLLEDDKANPGMNLEKLFMAACKKAVKAGYFLTNSDIGYLLTELDKAEHGFTCPHGRPTIIRISLSEIKRKFIRTN